MVFVMQTRLEWQPSASSTPEKGLSFDFESPIPFKSPNDYKILPNDWPYGLDEGISHLIVWLKNRLEIQPPYGDMTPNARKQVEDFVEERFVKPIAKLTGGTDSVLWFKNWVALQSVPGIDHVHILVRNVSTDFIDQQWTQGERPLQDLVNV